MAEKPFHPGQGFVFPKKKFGAREQSCQSQWFIDFPFLHYDVERDAIFCLTCMTAVQQRKVLRSKRSDPAFVSSYVMMCVAAIFSFARLCSEALCFFTD